MGSPFFPRRRNASCSGQYPCQQDLRSSCGIVKPDRCDINRSAKRFTARSGGFAAWPRLRRGIPNKWEHENVTHSLLPLLFRRPGGGRGVAYCPGTRTGRTQHHLTDRHPHGSAQTFPVLPSWGKCSEPHPGNRHGMAPWKEPIADISTCIRRWKVLRRIKAGRFPAFSSRAGPPISGHRASAQRPSPHDVFVRGSAPGIPSRVGPAGQLHSRKTLAAMAKAMALLMIDRFTSGYLSMLNTLSYLA